MKAERERLWAVKVQVSSDKSEEGRLAPNLDRGLNSGGGILWSNGGPKDAGSLP